ncbi:MAG: methylenetetrahydrofolate--tRNA-(uracil(54)-C(5))-methyltransferase (FADH(2)-oxidizing) TrmFO [Anaerolineae bacterium]|jgi:methylenetetrahydrofolate--tRNA-(uracil-5-)-methyltransferase|nr:methylenetetrahydrofolate--tRNA-(uracil(54)-C(5))-methyltransferase (FADH(2)-oxidizing) TrmFO [Anaerolineae bacterium]MBT4311457.1 methylenetetrahydrofolate--tRNA-(uracil(54)-C(5))-methyltransferase (FADH(2)-oxidizing) TrmFO [Anaerolineae bacterium]MBT4458637.1 methylenetetrahydrofolate--tRNA-(uracil(54)-C(5))-methyltransferase (FADH(2)-oxidizing) TrmFO [Anaerolineae bacterium]MBT6060116.1 methylenetetrahydrofolate--tRNA-(uracil(54)-C(5))-methyltransferase (FADH(2)-oxidizing) TrmFO [Anaerolin
MKPTQSITIIGGGLAGSEAAWQAATQNIHVKLFEMRPKKATGAHQSADLAELVCSNSLGSNLPDRASGLLKNELRRMGSMLLSCAEKTVIPAGGALAVDREIFAKAVTKKIDSHPNIEVIRKEMVEIPSEPTIIASGPLTSAKLSSAIAALTGEEHLYFFDALAPIVHHDSINMEVAFRASRYDRGKESEGDYINCPFTKEEYDKFIQALLEAERIKLHSFELEIEKGVKAGAHHYFEGCLPAEIIAERGEKSLAFGPLRPVGLRDPRTDKRPYAVLQLRQDNLAGDLYNLVGFQTNLKFSEQQRVFRMIPGLEKVEFERYGQMHRNTFIASPRLLRPTLQFHNRDNLFFAGQITGVEGYIGNVATGLLAGQNIARLLAGHPPLQLPETTMLGALCHYITNAAPKDFQPMKANFGIMPPLEQSGKKRGKRERAALRAERALIDLEEYLSKI